MNKIVPLENFEDSLVLHITGNYVNNSLPSADYYLEAANEYSGEPISLKKLGYEDGKLL